MTQVATLRRAPGNAQAQLAKVVLRDVAFVLAMTARLKAEMDASRATVQLPQLAVQTGGSGEFPSDQSI